MYSLLMNQDFSTPPLWWVGTENIHTCSGSWERIKSKVTLISTFDSWIMDFTTRDTIPYNSVLSWLWSVEWFSRMNSIFTRSFLPLNYTFSRLHTMLSCWELPGKSRYWAGSMDPLSTTQWHTSLAAGCLVFWSDVKWNVMSRNLQK